VRAGPGEREGRREELYTVVFRDEDGDEVPYRTPREAEWAGFEPGRAYRAKVKRGEVVEVLGPG
jgi:hypothetical protein